MTARLYTIKNRKTQEIVLVEAVTQTQAYWRLCREDYEIAVTKAIDVGPHILKLGRVITAIMADFRDELPLSREPNTIHGAGDDHKDGSNTLRAGQASTFEAKALAAIANERALRGQGRIQTNGD